MQGGVNSCHGIALSLEMPKGCLLAKDFLNHKYHSKRRAFLAHVAAALATRGLVAPRSQFSTSSGDPRRQDMLVEPSGTDAHLRLTVRIPASCFPLRKLGPDRNSLRTATEETARALTAASRSGAPPSSEQHGATTPLATPVYNSGIVADVMHHAHCVALGELAAQAPCVTGAAVLLLLWVERNAVPSRHTAALGNAVTATLASVVESGTVVRPSVYPALPAFQLYA